MTRVPIELMNVRENWVLLVAIPKISMDTNIQKAVGLSSTTNPKPKGQPSISLPAQANLTQQKAEPLRCLALRTRGALPEIRGHAYGAGAGYAWIMAKP